MSVLDIIECFWQKSSVITYVISPNTCNMCLEHEKEQIIMRKFVLFQCEFKEFKVLIANFDNFRFKLNSYSFEQK